jgi:hypothetical protein
LTPPTDSFLSSFYKVGVEKRGRVRGIPRKTGDSIWWSANKKEK